MKPTYSIDSKTKLILVTHKVAPTIEEWIKVMKSVFADPLYGSGFSFVFDHRSIEAPSTDYIRRKIMFLAHHREQLKGSRLAVIVNDQANLGMFRMAQILSEGVPVSIGVFTDPKEAEAWARSVTRPTLKHS